MLLRAQSILPSRAFQAACLLLVVFTIVISVYRVTGGHLVFSNVPLNPSTSVTSSTSTETENDLNSTLLESAPKYIKAIISPEDTSFPRLDCPASNRSRYEYLQNNPSQPQLPKYFFALDLRQSAKVLPRLLGSIVEAMRFLGAGNCALSIVEGGSTDGTYEILKSLYGEMDNLGIRYNFQRSGINTKVGDRVKGLAELRNLALQPFVANPDRYSNDLTVIFLNDVSICIEDILELLHQKIYQGADMTCAMDWTYVGQDPTFYDVWVARDMNGDSFFNIPEDGNWDSAWNVFWNNPAALEHYQSHKSFQVFSCWNGATAFIAKPFFEQKIKFRTHRDKECSGQGEPQLFCKDLWGLGYGKIAVIPSINIEYSDDAARKIKAAKGYTSQWAEGDTEKIQWEIAPPAKVKCMNGYANQMWVPWNEGL